MITTIKLRKTLICLLVVDTPTTRDPQPSPRHLRVRSKFLRSHKRQTRDRREMSICANAVVHGGTCLVLCMPCLEMLFKYVLLFITTTTTGEHIRGGFTGEHVRGGFRDLIFRQEPKSPGQRPTSAASICPELRGRSSWG